MKNQWQLQKIFAYSAVLFLCLLCFALLATPTNANSTNNQTQTNQQPTQQIDDELTNAALPAGIIISEVDTLNDKIELINPTGGSIDMTSWWLCNRVNGTPFYAQITSNTTIDVALSTATSYNVGPGEILVLDITSGFLPNANGELGLYNVNSFTSAAAIEDYILWGASGIRDSVAAAAGIWVDNDSIDVSSLGAGETIQLILGQPGNAAAEYVIAPSTLGAANIPDSTTVTLSGGDLTITDTSGGDSDDNLTLIYASGTYTLTDNGGIPITTTIAGQIGAGTPTITFPDTGITSITFNLLAGNDLVNIAGVQNSLTGGFTIDGGIGVDSATINSSLNTNNGNVDLAAEMVTINQSIAAGTGNITLTADNLTIGAALSGSGTLTIEPQNAGETIGLGGATGALNLDDTEISNLTDGFTVINIGTTEAFTITLDTVTFLDPVTLTSITINDGSGTDLTAPQVTFDATVAPGASPGILIVNGDVIFADDSAFAVEIDGFTAGTGAGFHDQLDVAGIVTIGNNVGLNLTFLGNYTHGSGDITLVNNDGGDGVIGNFDALAEGTQTNSGNSPNFTISYAGGSSNDIVLTAVSPSTVTLQNSATQSPPFQMLTILLLLFAFITISLILRHELVNKN